MNGSGCKNCPVKPCETVNYRGSTCAAQRARYGLGDHMTKGDKIRAMSDEELANVLCFYGPFCELCEIADKDIACDVDTCIASAIKWLQQPSEGD